MHPRAKESCDLEARRIHKWAIRAQCEESQPGDEPGMLREHPGGPPS